MATYTSKYHLEKPDQTDIYNIDVHNANSDAIDAALAAKPDSSNLATVESTNKASRAYTVGEYLVYNGLLYRVSAAIASGGTLTPGTNLTATTTGAQLKSLNDSLTPVVLSGITGSTYVTNFDCGGWKFGKYASGQCVFKLLAGFTQTGTAIAYGLPKCAMNKQFIGTCVAGTRAGMSTRFRIVASSGTIESYYSADVLTAGDTWIIPFDYITN